MLTPTQVIEIQYEADNAYQHGDSSDGNPYPTGSHEGLVWAEQLNYREQQEQQQHEH